MSRHHARHDHHVERVPRELLPKDAFAFAERTGLEWLLNREYPPEREEAA